MRIVFVVHHYPPDVNSTGRLVSQLAARFREHGHEISIITSLPHYEEFRIWPDFRRKVIQREVSNGIDIWRVWCFAPGKKSMRNRLLNYLTFNFMATAVGLWVNRRSRTDLIFATNGSFFTGITAWISRRKRTPLIYNVQDLYPEVPILAGQLRNPIVIAALRGTAKLMYRKATVITVITPSFHEFLVSMGVSGEKIRVIPNFVDTEFIRPLPRDNPYARTMEFASRFVVAHSGNLGYVYDLFTLLDAAKELSDLDILFAIIGDGVVKAQLQERALQGGLTNVRFLPFVPEEDLPWLRASIDVQLALYVPGAARHSMPSKVYEILASGRPVLASAEAGSDLERLVRESGGGICIEPGNAEGLAEAVRRFRNDPAWRVEMGSDGRRHIEERYSLSHIVSRYERLFNETREGAR